MRRQINAELRFQKNMVPKNVKISEPTYYGDYFRYDEVREDILNLLRFDIFLDSNIIFLDTKKDIVLCYMDKFNHVQKNCLI